MDDTISRQAAIDIFDDYNISVENGDLEAYCRDRKRLCELPPAQPEPHWIPVTERLPEENDYKSCIECLDGAVWYFSENGTMGIGYYYESTKEWSTTDDLKTDGKVVAWMPLQEPYRGEDK